MAVNHNINVNFRKSAGNLATARTSAVNSVTRTTERQTSSSLKSLSRGIRAVRTADLGSLGLFGSGSTLSMALTVAQEGIKLANKAYDFYLDYDLARTGETMSIGNIKRVKGYFLNPASYVIDVTWGKYLQQLVVNRQNNANAYYRELSGNLIVGNQYRGQR